MKVVLEILFLAFGNANFEFARLGKYTWRSYMVAKALLPTNRVKLMNKMEFAKVALDKDFTSFLIQIAILEAKRSIHPLRTAK